ncbi:MAG: D-glycero-beta-D-manno-heptose-7-phosphate kinase [Chlorobi bacterium]|nr:D-glycero-beta-D-manno-heptose-7-phosphate kinase [Chlorobiota bacterium]
MDGVSVERCRQWLHELPSKRIAVVGDLMLDHYYIGSVSRISPEAPVPVVELERETYRLGGAANVAHNLRMLGCQVVLCGVVGDDSSGAELLELADELGIETSGIVQEHPRPTTVKTRVIGNNQQLLRLDREQRLPIADDSAERILSALDRADTVAAVILEDYNKGVLTPALIERVVAWAQQRGIPVLVDPKTENFFAYRGVTVFKPNQKEAQHALGVRLDSDESIVSAGIELIERLTAEYVLVTLGARGMMLVERNGQYRHIPSEARHVADVSGAGDTVIATLAAMMVTGATIVQAAVLASIAAGVVCGEPGVVPITAAGLLAAIEQIEPIASGLSDTAIGAHLAAD